MNVIKRITAVFMAVFLLATTVVSANAVGLTEADRKEVTDEIFEDLWFDGSGLYDDYYKATESTVLVEHNPYAAVIYMMVEAKVSISDIQSLQDYYDGVNSDDFWDFDNENDLKKIKMNDKYKNSLIIEYEFEFSMNDRGKVYDYGIWTFENNDHNKFYGYFKEDDENFTLYEDGTDKVLGIYPKLIGYEYLDDEAGNGSSGSADGGSGSAGGNNGTGSAASSEYYSDDEADGPTSRPKDTSDSDTKVKGTPSSSVDGANTFSTKSEVSGNNPAVTPEIVSTVDALKSSASTQTNEKITLNTSISPESHTAKNVTVLVVVLAVIAVGIYLISRNKKSNKDTNN